ncbi:MAG: UDP-N-acetylmuramyl-tripeptide synthetase [Polyangiaceae bacterium]|nr:UDP-N-acetylmuramyl-tripeptide synthetase [Polyangiaceae bacterium]
MKRLVYPAAPTWAAKLPTVGVTGTNGKTTTTTWIANALSFGTGGPVVRATTLGVMLGDERLAVTSDYDGFLEAMRIGLSRGARAAAIELTSEALSAGFIHGWPATVGVFTNLTHDHLDAHKSAEHYLASKAQLFVHLPAGGTAVLNGADPACELLAEVVPKHATTVWYAAPGRGSTRVCTHPDIEVVRAEPTWLGTHLTLRGGPLFEGLPDKVLVKGIGLVYAENAAAAIAGACAWGVPARVATSAIESAEPPPGRFEVVWEQPYLVVDYAHSPDAVRQLVYTAKALCRGRVTLVMGAGGERDRDKRRPMGAAAQLADRVIVTNDNPRREDPRAIADAVMEGLLEHPNAEIIADRGEAIDAAVRDASESDVVVVAGRGHETEQVFATGRVRFLDAERLKLAAEKLGRGMPKYG